MDDAKLKEVYQHGMEHGFVLLQEKLIRSLDSRDVRMRLGVKNTKGLKDLIRGMKIT